MAVAVAVAVTVATQYPQHTIIVIGKSRVQLSQQGQQGQQGLQAMHQSQAPPPTPGSKRSIRRPPTPSTLDCCTCLPYKYTYKYLLMDNHDHVYRVRNVRTVQARETWQRTVWETIYTLRPPPSVDTR